MSFRWPEWGFPSDRTLEIARLGVQSGLVPLFEMEEGSLTRVRKIKKKIPVDGYLKTQKRFRHLFATDKGGKVVEEIQALADENIKRFGLQRDE